MKERLQRLLDRVAPVRPPGADRGYRRLLRWAALPVTDRRWAAPLAAAALGFGLFAGIAIGPGTTGTLATAGPQLIELPPLLSDDEGEKGAEAEVETSAESGGIAESGGSGEEAGAFEFEEASSSAYEAPLEAEAPAATPASPAKEPTPEDEAEPEEEAETMSGVVVHVNPAAGSYTLVETGGLMNAVHAAKLPVPGAVVSVPVRALANGTFAEAGARKQSGTKTQASFSGIVTFVDSDPAAPAYAVSKRGVSLLVRVHPDPAGAPAELPQLGAFATVVATIEKAAPATATEPPVEAASPAPATPAPTCAPDPAQPPVVPAPPAILWQSRLDADGAPFASSDFAGVVTAICPEEAKLSLSGDDLRQSGKDILFTVPEGIDLGKIEVGDSVAATAAIEAGGALTLTGLASDERAKGADDAALTQGDLSSHKPK